MGLILEVLGLVVAFVMAMEALRRFGIDVGWLNPLTFFHRRRWKKKVSTPPLYALQHPVEVVGVMALAIIEATGLVSAEQKARVQEIFSRQLKMTEASAAELYISSAYLLRQHALQASEVPAVLQASAEKFTDYHLQTLKMVMRETALIEPPVNAAQQQLIDAVENFYAQKKSAPTSWTS